MFFFCFLKKTQNVITNNFFNIFLKLMIPNYMFLQSVSVCTITSTLLKWFPLWKNTQSAAAGHTWMMTFVKVWLNEYKDPDLCPLLLYFKQNKWGYVKVSSLTECIVHTSIWLLPSVKSKITPPFILSHSSIASCASFLSNISPRGAISKRSKEIFFVSVDEFSSVMMRAHRDRGQH